jgi:hypothetical protein
MRKIRNQSHEHHTPMEYRRERPSELVRNLHPLKPSRAARSILKQWARSRKISYGTMSYSNSAFQVHCYLDRSDTSPIAHVSYFFHANGQNIVGPHRQRYSCVCPFGPANWNQNVWRVWMPSLPRSLDEIRPSHSLFWDRVYRPDRQTMKVRDDSTFWMVWESDM